MSIKQSLKDERGIAHLGLIVLVIAVIGFGAFAYMRVSSSNSDDTATSTTQSQTQNTEGLEEKRAVEAEQAANKAGDEAETANINSAVKEDENVVE